MSYEMITTMLRRQHHGRFFVWKDSIYYERLMIICVLCWKHHHIINRNFFLNSWKWIFSWPYSSHAMGARTNNCVNWALWESVVDNKSMYNLYGHFGEHSPQHAILQKGNMHEGPMSWFEFDCVLLSIPRLDGWGSSRVQITKRETNPKQTPRSIYATTTRARV